MNKQRLSGDTAYMHEIDGVRGIALTLVVLFHLFGNGRISGGVDVFLVISAYFLTRKLLGHFRSLQSLDPVPPQGNFQWMRTHFIRVGTRLIPSAMIVIAGVLVATLLWSPATQYIQTLREAVASALYYENWELIYSQLAYGAAGPDSSPLQHFWSLSVQGQFFLVWPFLALVMFYITRRASNLFRNSFFGVLTVLTVASFVWATVSVKFDQQVAYFDTYARFWELGAGALVAFIPSQMFSYAWVKEAAVWAGLAMIVACGFLFDGGSQFPGFATLWPVLATVLVLFGASRSTKRGYASYALNIKPVRFLSRISYELYLWHWPVLIFYMQARSYDQVGWRGGALILVISLLLAIATERLVMMRPLRSFQQVSWKHAITLPLIPLITVTAAALGWGAVERTAHEEALRIASQPSPDHIGARALTHPSDNTGEASRVEVIPSLEAANDDLPSIYSEGCIQNYRNEPGMDEVLVCDIDNYGNAKTVVLTGGSYSVQWYPALKTVAEEQDWRLLVIEKDGCRLSSENQQSTCEEWNSHAIDVISSYSPDAVFTLGTVVEHEDPEAFEQGIFDQVNLLANRDIDVLGFRGTPKFPFDIPECLDGQNWDYEACSKARKDIFRPSLFEPTETSLPENFSFLDLTDAICGPSTCEPVVGNILLYRDQGHLTQTYTKTLAPALELEMRDAMPDLFK